MILHNRSAPGFKDPGHGLVASADISFAEETFIAMKKAFKGWTGNVDKKFKDSAPSDITKDFLH